MSKSEQIGELNNLELKEINEKFRITQRLIDGMLQTFNDEYLSQYLNLARHDLTDRHTLGSIVPHDSILNLTDVSLLNNNLLSNVNKVLKVNSTGTVVSADVVSALCSILGTDGQINVVDNGNETFTISLDQPTINWHTTDKIFTVSDLKQIHIFNSASNLECWLPSVDANYIGYWILIAKYGTGDLTIYSADADTILDSTAGGSIECTDNTYEMEKMNLILLTETEWHNWHSCFGIWSTR